MTETASLISRDAKNAVEIRDTEVERLADYAGISIAFQVERIMRVAQPEVSRAGFVLTEHVVDHPYAKDYDAVPGSAPADWKWRFDTSQWRQFTALQNGRRVGGAVAAFRTVDLDLLEQRDDMALLWDLRVRSECRGAGIGSALVAAVENWAKTNKCIELRVETQNTNVPACRFYAKQQFVLTKITRGAYAEFPEEVQLIWAKGVG